MNLGGKWEKFGIKQLLWYITKDVPREFTLAGRDCFDSGKSWVLGILQRLHWMAQVKIGVPVEVVSTTLHAECVH